MTPTTRNKTPLGSKPWFKLKPETKKTANIAIINDIGIAAENYLDFEEGIDFLSGIDEDHEIVNDNLRYPQFKWDNRSLTYFIDPVDGQFIQRLSETYVYPDKISSPAFGEGDDSLVIKTNSTPDGAY